MSSTPQKTPGKKPYRSPSLVRYGDLARITSNVGTTGMADGGKGKKSMTSP